MGLRPPRAIAIRLILLGTVLLGSVACGKKGPPLAPRVRIPAAVETLTATRLGNDVHITVTVPSTNIDKSMPADISRVDVYGYTGAAPPAALDVAVVGDVVASIPVEMLGELDEPAATDAPFPPSGRALPGMAVTVRDRLTPDEFVQGRVPVDPRRRPPVAPVTAAPVNPVMRRFYFALPFSQRGQNGPAGGRAELVLTALPDPPANLNAGYGLDNIWVTWEPAGGLLGFLLDRPLPPEAAPFLGVPLPVAPGAPAAVDTAVPPGPTTYQVYRELSPDPLVLPVPGALPPWSAPVPTALTATPLSTTTVTDAVVPGRLHCYEVRARRGTVVSDPSSRVCVNPTDIFPPGAPSGLAAVASEGGISLIWEPNSDADLGGYLILRREAQSDTLRQLTASPIPEARYRDTTVQPGTRYTYTVIAVDTRLPLPNVSAESAPVEETAR